MKMRPKEMWTRKERGKTQLEIGRRKNMEARENETEVNREYAS